MLTTTPLGLEVQALGMQYRSAQKPVFRNLNFGVDIGDRVALLGRNGQGKTTLIKLLGGIVRPTAGKIDWHISQSWPIGFHGGFQGSLSGIDNIRFLARIYGRPFQDMLAQVDDFAELGKSLLLPVKHYSSGMRARLAFGLSLAIEFDCYLIDELVSVGDARFQRKCQFELFQKRSHRTFILASHDLNLIQNYCDSALIIEGGEAKKFADINEAVETYRWLKAT